MDTRWTEKPEQYVTPSTQKVANLGKNENLNKHIGIINAAIEALDDSIEKKSMTPSDKLRVGMILGECPRIEDTKLVPCDASIGECGSPDDLLNPDLFPGGYKVWTSDKKSVKNCTIPSNFRSVKVGTPITQVKEKTEIEREVERHQRLTALIEAESVKLDRLFLFFDHITNCEVFQEEETCLQPTLGSLGVTGKNADAPRCLWMKDTQSCKPSVAYEREIGAVAERNLTKFNRELKDNEAKLADRNVADYKFTLRTRRPVALKGDSHSRKIAEAFERWDNLMTQKRILEAKIYAMEDARVKAKTRIHMTQDQYIQYRALMQECANSLDSNRSWGSCVDTTVGNKQICQILATGKGNKGGMKKKDDIKPNERKNVVDNRKAYCVPSMGQQAGLYAHNPNTGKVLFFDNFGNMDTYADPLRSWWDLRNWKLKNDKTGIKGDAFLNSGWLASIARWGGRLRGKEMDDDEDIRTVDIAALDKNMNLSARARIIQRNMQLFFESFALT